MPPSTPSLKPQDVLVACQLVLMPDPCSQALLAEKLHLSSRTVFDSIQRLKRARLATQAAFHPVKVVGARLLELLVHGVPTVYFPQKTALVRGIPTASYSPLFRERFAGERSGQRPDVPLVWPYSKGKEVGEGLVPIYPSIPIACSQSPELYQFMATIEMLRVGRVRERDAAVTYLEEILGVNLEDRIVEEASA